MSVARTASRHRATEGPEVLGAETAGELARVFKALSDPSRLRLIHALIGGERCVHDLTELLGMEQSAVSHQLRSLRHQRLVRFRKAGRHVYYALDDAHVRRLFRLALTHVGHAGASR